LEQFSQYLEEKIIFLICFPILQQMQCISQDNWNHQVHLQLITV